MPKPAAAQAAGAGGLDFLRDREARAARPDDEEAELPGAREVRVRVEPGQPRQVEVERDHGGDAEALGGARERRGVERVERAAEERDAVEPLDQRPDRGGRSEEGRG